MTELIQLIAAFGGGIGFSLIFGLHGKQLPIAALGSVLTWGCYLLASIAKCPTMLAIFLASVFGASCTVLLAKVLKAPKSVFLFSMLHPLIPGSSLYLTMQNLLTKDFEMFFSYGLKTLSSTFLISAGIITILLFERFVIQVKSKTHD